MATKRAPKLTTKQLRAVALLINGLEWKAVAAKLEIPYSRLRNWLRNPLFRKLYEESTERLMEAAAAVAKAKIDKMLGIIEHVALAGEEERDRVKAAVAFLNAVLKLHEISTLRRELAEFMDLKQLIADRGGVHGVGIASNGNPAAAPQAGEAVRGGGEAGGAAAGAPPSDRA
jgi:hypothetical protein